MKKRAEKEFAKKIDFSTFLLRKTDLKLIRESAIKKIFGDFETAYIIYRYTFISLCLCYVKLVLKGIYKIELNEKKISFCKSVRCISISKFYNFTGNTNSFDYA